MDHGCKGDDMKTKSLSDGNNPKSDAIDVNEELRLAKQIIERSPVILFRRKPAGESSLVYVSENISRFGYSAKDFLSGKARFPDLVHPDDMDRVRSEIVGYAEKGTSDYTQSYRIITREGDVRWVEDTTTTERDAHGNIVFYQGIVVDVTERKRAEEKLRKNELKFSRIIETTAEGFVMMDNDFKFTEVNDAFCQMLGYARDEIVGRSPFDLATREFNRFLQANAEKLLSRTHRIFEGAYVAKDGHTIPVLIHGNTFYDDAGRKIGHVAFVSDLTDQKRSLLLAGEVQKSLLPKEPPKIPGLDIAGRSIPCEEIGGDYYDFLLPGEGLKEKYDSLLSVAVCDIAGHGVDSALLMATARAVLRDRFVASASLDEMVGEMNRILMPDFRINSTFMTLFALQINSDCRGLRWVRAGHDPALIYWPNQNDFSELAGPGIPLGVTDDWQVAVGQIDRLQPGCVIALGTDGIWETHNSGGELFGKQRFKQILQKRAAEKADTILESVYEELFKFSTGLKPDDDITLVIVKVIAS